MAKRTAGEGRWIVFFYWVPSRPVKNRMRLWRMLVKSGAVPLKGGVYVLPNTDGHREKLQWLASEAQHMGGEGAFLMTDKIEPLGDREMEALFHKNISAAYKRVENELAVLERKFGAAKKGGGLLPRNGQNITRLLSRLITEFEDIRKTDFFRSPSGSSLDKRIAAFKADSDSMRNAESGQRPAAIKSKNIPDYQGRLWVTRKRPFVDRIASAWLIRKFIDKNGVFLFMDEKDIGRAGEGRVTFDVGGGEFTHMAGHCTFEVIMRSFGIRDKAVRKIAEIVHELDIMDDKYKNPECGGIEAMLSGLRKSIKDDEGLLQKGMEVFDMLYQAKAA